MPLWYLTQIGTCERVAKPTCLFLGLFVWGDGYALVSFVGKGPSMNKSKNARRSVSHVNMISRISRIQKVEDIWKFSARTLDPRVRALTLVRNESSVPSTPGAGIPHGAVGGPSNFLVRTAYHVSSLVFTRTAPDKGREVVQLIGVLSYILHHWDI